MKYTVYVVQCQNYYKVGMTHDIHKRLKAFKIGNPFPLTISHEINGLTKEQACFIEHFTHEQLKEYHVQGEWFCCSLETIKRALSFDIKNEQVSASYVDVITTNPMVSNAIIIEMWSQGLTSFK